MPDRQDRTGFNVRLPSQFIWKPKKEKKSTRRLFHTFPFEKQMLWVLQHVLHAFPHPECMAGSLLFNEQCHLKFVQWHLHSNCPEMLYIWEASQGINLEANCIKLVIWLALLE